MTARVLHQPAVPTNSPACQNRHKPFLKRQDSFDKMQKTLVQAKLLCQFTIPTNSSITGIDVDNNDYILISDGVNQTVFLYKKDGELVGKHTFKWPIWDCAMLSDEKIALLTDMGIQVYSQDFYLMYKIPLKTFSPRHMVIDQDDFIVIGDVEADKVRIYDGNSGQPLNEFSARGLKKSEPIKNMLNNQYQTSIAVNQEDEVIIADPVDPVINMFSNTGCKLRTVPITELKPTPKHMIQPRAICTDLQNRVWFAEENGKYMQRVPVKDPKAMAESTEFILLEPLGITKPQAMCFMKNGHMVIVDQANRASILTIDS